MTATVEPEVGKSRRRKEDARLITGRTRWTDNITLPGMLHMAILRSPFAHARITSIDTSAAKSAVRRHRRLHRRGPGPDEPVGLPCAWPITPDMKAPRRPVLAVDTVNFAGEGVAVVVARTSAEAARRARGDRRRLRRAAGGARHGSRDRRRRPAGARRPGHQHERRLGVRLRRGRHRRQRRGRDQLVRDRRRAAVPPAAADPGVHGAARLRRRPDRRADHHVVGHPDPAHPAADARR